MYAPLFRLGAERFLFAYKDQMFQTREAAEMRGKELAYWFRNNQKPIEYLEVVDPVQFGRRPVVSIMGFKICFVDREMEAKKKNARGRR